MGLTRSLVPATTMRVCSIKLIKEVRFVFKLKVFERNVHNEHLVFSPLLPFLLSSLSTPCEKPVPINLCSHLVFPSPEIVLCHSWLFTKI